MFSKINQHYINITKYTMQHNMTIDYLGVGQKWMGPYTIHPITPPLLGKFPEIKVWGLDFPNVINFWRQD